MTICHDTICLLLQNPKSFIAPWKASDSGTLSMGQWLFSVADNLEVLQYHLHMMRYDCCGILKFCAEGRCLVTGTDRHGPDIFEVVNFDLMCSSFQLNMFEKVFILMIRIVQHMHQEYMA
jgi:hypothetical protein